MNDDRIIRITDHEPHVIEPTVEIEPRIIERTAEVESNELSNGQVVGIAVGAAVALGTLVMALGPREPEKPPHGGGRRTVVRGAHSVVREVPGTESLAVVKNGKLTGKSRKRLESEVGALQQEIERLGKIAERQAREDRQPVPIESVLLPVSGMESAKMADDTTVAVIKNGKLTRRTRKELHKQVNAIQKDIDRLNKATRNAASRQKHPAPTVGDVRETATDIGQGASKRLTVAGAATAAAAAPLIERARGIALPDGAQQATDTAQKHVRHLARSTQKGASQLADSTQKNVSQLADSTQKGASQLVGSTQKSVSQLAGTAQKSISQFADTAQKGARQLADTTREHTSDLAERVRGDLLPQLAEQAGKVQERVRDEVLPKLAERAQQIRDDVTPQLADAASKAGAQASALAATGTALSRDKVRELAKTDLATDFTRRAKQQTHRGRKEAAKRLSALAAQIEPPKQRRNLTGLWVFAALAAAGGALYYFVFRNEERRKKVIETTQSLVEQGREIIRDFQGYDEEF